MECGDLSPLSFVGHRRLWKKRATMLIKGSPGIESADRSAHSKPKTIDFISLHEYCHHPQVRHFAAPRFRGDKR